MNAIYHRLFVVLVLSMFVGKAYSIHALTIADSTVEIHIPSSSIEIFEDTGNIFRYEDVSKVAFNQKFKAFTSSGFDNENHSAYWLKFKFINQSSSYKKWILQAPLHADYIEVYIPDETGEMKKLIGGQSLLFASRQYQIRSLVFDLPPQRNQEITIYIKTYSRGHTDLSFLISNQIRYTEVLVKTYSFLGLIYGILFLMALYNFILYLSIKDKIYIYYVLYTFCSALFISWKDGIGFEIVWPDYPSFNIYHHKIGLFLLVITFTLYGHDFLELKKNHRKLHLITYVLIGINSIYFLVVFFISDYFDALPISYLVTLLFFYGVVIYYLIEGYKPARYLFLGFTSLLIALIVIKLRYMSWMDWNWFAEYVLSYAVVVEAISMSLAIRDKLIFLRKEKEKAQKEKENAQESMIFQLQENEKLKDKVNKELEQKVKERTHELQNNMQELSTAKEKLAFAYEELGKMSSKLDMDNWKLKKDIKEERQMRINAEIVSFQKFIELFPNESACLRFLFNKKWGEDGNSYECNRCNNKKSSEISNIQFAKKCTKCNYIETVTANTLFHRVKFEMNKAFYVVYVTSRSTDTTIAELSKEIALRSNTCWKFKKRVEERMDEVKKKHKIYEISNWEILI